MTDDYDHYNNYDHNDHMIIRFLMHMVSMTMIIREAIVKKIPFFYEILS